MSDIATLVAAHPLVLGNQGNDVRQLQVSLAARGYPLKGTGYFGSATDAAVEAFQLRSGLFVDGVVGPITARALDASTLPTVPSVHQEVARPLWLQVSIQHIGLREGSGSKDNPELLSDIQEVAKDFDHDSIPWCAGWVSFCLVRAGLKPSKLPLWALSYADGWGVKLNGPAVGAIAVKHRDGGGHVTFVAGRTASGGLACCGGNQNDEVNISGYSSGVFDGFYWPKGVALPMVGMASLPVVKADGSVVVKES